MMPILGLYIHVPFCNSKCDYCAFTSVTRWDKTTEEAFVARVLNDLDSYAGQLDQVTTAYIGGGTPSALRSESLARLLAAVRTTATNVREITLEANPQSASYEIISVAVAGGVTRLSLGVQSFDSRVLSTIGRRKTTPDRISEIRSGWSRDLSVDLIIDTPDVHEGDTLSSVGRALGLSLDHLSLYSLSVEPGTPLSGRISQDRDLALSQAEDETILQRLAEAGLARYELSNFARPGCECEHNRNYWTQRGYLGVGPSAVSTLYGENGALRITQPESIEAYVRGDPTDATYEHLDRGDLLVEHIMMGLRTREGINYRSMERRYGCHLGALAPREVARYIEQGMLVERPDGVAGTTRGWRYLDAVLRSLIGEVCANLDTLQV